MGPADTKPPPLLTLCLPALDVITPIILAQVARSLDKAQLSDVCDSVTIALAEVLNKVIEHGYQGRLGAVAVSVTRTAQKLTITVTDWGTTYPNAEIPGCAAPDPTELAEGGYGWFLVKSVMSRVTYDRVARANSLVLTLDL